MERDRGQCHCRRHGGGREQDQERSDSATSALVYVIRIIPSLWRPGRTKRQRWTWTRLYVHGSLRPTTIASGHSVRAIPSNIKSGTITKSSAPPFALHEERRSSAQDPSLPFENTISARDGIPCVLGDGSSHPIARRVAVSTISEWTRCQPELSYSRSTCASESCPIPFYEHHKRML